MVFFLLGAIKPLQNDLKNLSFIHFARWVAIKRNAAGFLVGTPRVLLGAAFEATFASSFRNDYQVIELPDGAIIETPPMRVL